MTRVDTLSDENKRKVAFVTIAAFTAVFAFAAANALLWSAKFTWAKHQLNGLVETMVERSNYAIDKVVMTQIELMAAGHTSCSLTTVEALQGAVYADGAVKDLHILNGETSCRAFQEIETGPLNLKNALNSGASARNESFSLSVLSEADWRGLGVFRELVPGKFMLAMMSKEYLIFDMLPPNIRDTATVSLALANGDQFASYEPNASSNTVTENSITFEARSDRYPVIATMTANSNAILSVYDGVLIPIQLALAVTAILAGLASARALVRKPTETDTLRAAIEQGHIKPHFQPIVSLKTGAIVGCEVLARWIKPDGTQISPGQFIPLAELTGLACPLTAKLVRDTGSLIGPSIQDRDGFKINFNVSPRQLQREGFADRFITLAERHEISRKSIVVELTERQSLETIEEMRMRLSDLHTRGVRVAIDDIGTGQNGLALLQFCGADILKIDKLFIDMIDTDPRTRSMIELLVQVARDYGMRVVAEGVERPEQAEALQSLGVDEAQGYHFARPMPADEFLALLEEESDRHFKTIEHETGEAPREKPIQELVTINAA
ncbi:MAG: EAL domain-containing protein [Pseudomonadota bacterium]